MCDILSIFSFKNAKSFFFILRKIFLKFVVELIALSYELRAMSYT